MGDKRRQEPCNEHEPCSQDAYTILTRMLADADRLCMTKDALLTGQAAQLRGRIAAMVAVAVPPDALLAEARS